MQPRNVIFSLILVLAVLAFAVIKVRFLEPERKLTFNRNPSRIKYSELALCRMDCYQISANDITGVLKNGKINKEKSDFKKQPCSVFQILGRIKKGVDVLITVEQCGKVANILNCNQSSGVIACTCPGSENPPVSFYKK